LKAETIKRLILCHKKARSKRDYRTMSNIENILYRKKQYVAMEMVHEARYLGAYAMYANLEEYLNFN